VESVKTGSSFHALAKVLLFGFCFFSFAGPQIALPLPLWLTVTEEDSKVGAGKIEQHASKD